MNWTKSADGLEIYYEDTQTAGPVIAFQSGFMGIHDIWKYQVAELGGSFRCITHDNRGYGFSDSPEDSDFYSVENNAEDMRAVLDAAGVDEKILMVTHSMGSSYALAFAMKYPERLKGIIFMGGAVIGGEPLRRNGAGEDVFSQHHTGPVASMTFYANLGLEKSIAAEAAKWRRHVFLNQTRAMMNFLPAADDIAAIQVPALVLHGSEDVVTPLAFPQELAGTLARAELQMIEGANHFPQTEQPAVINDIITGFEKSLQ